MPLCIENVEIWSDVTKALLTDTAVSAAREVLRIGGVKNLGNVWSKSIVLENKVVINFDFRLVGSDWPPAR